MIGRGDELSRYVRESVRANGLTYRGLAARAVDPVSGQSLSRQWLTRLGNGQVARSAEPWRLRAVAGALGVDSELIRGLAARQWLEFDVAHISLGNPYEWALYLQRRGLTEEEQESLRWLVADFIRRQEDAPGCGDDDDDDDDESARTAGGEAKTLRQSGKLAGHGCAAQAATAAPK